MAALIDAQARKLRPQLLGTMMRGEAGEPAPHRLHFRRTVDPEQRKRMSDLWAALNADPEMKELAAKSGFELVDVGVDGMDAFMKEKVKLYTDAAKKLGMGK